LPIIPFGNKYISLLISFKIKKFCQGNIPVSFTMINIVNKNKSVEAEK